MSLTVDEGEAEAKEIDVAENEDFRVVIKTRKATPRLPLRNVVQENKSVMARQR